LPRADVHLRIPRHSDTNGDPDTDANADKYRHSFTDKHAGRRATAGYADTGGYRNTDTVAHVGGNGHVYATTDVHSLLPDGSRGNGDFYSNPDRSGSVVHTYTDRNGDSRWYRVVLHNANTTGHTNQLCRIPSQSPGVKHRVP
jgi:hypothetical protein